MLVAASTGKIGRGFGKHAGEWIRRVEIRKEEIPGSMLASMALKGERLRSVFSPNGTLISASAAPHCGVLLKNGINAFKVKVTAKVQNVSECLSE